MMSDEASKSPHCYLSSFLFHIKKNKGEMILSETAQFKHLTRRFVSIHDSKHVVYLGLLIVAQ